MHKLVDFNQRFLSDFHCHLCYCWDIWETCTLGVQIEKVEEHIILYFDASMEHSTTCLSIIEQTWRKSMEICAYDWESWEDHESTINFVRGIICWLSHILMSLVNEACFLSILFDCFFDDASCYIPNLLQTKYVEFAKLIDKHVGHSSTLTATCMTKIFWAHRDELSVKTQEPYLIPRSFLLRQNDLLYLCPG